MSLSTRRNPGTRGAADGSRTLTLRDDQPREDDGAGAPGAGPSGTAPDDGVLHLRGGPHAARPRRVMWTEDTVDNEGAGRKKSKSACAGRGAQ
jgi:protein phosphatase 1 regulatory subunit 11